MYLISLYFDERADARIRQYIKAVAKKTNNTYMLDGDVPPHITISAFESRQEKVVMEALDMCMNTFKMVNVGRGVVQWVSVGAFFPHVLYLSPVLNEYLHQMSVAVFETLQGVEHTLIRKCYQPFAWMPHTTIGKKLSDEEMREGFAVLQNSFGMFSGEVVKIGLAKTNPYEDIAVWEFR